MLKLKRKTTVMKKESDCRIKCGLILFCGGLRPTLVLNSADLIVGLNPAHGFFYLKIRILVL